MKVKGLVTAVLGIVGAAIMMGGFAGCSFFQEHERVNNYIDKNGHTISASVDVSNGWSCETYYSTVLIYDHDSTEDKSVTATATTIDKSTYNLYRQVALKDMFSEDIKGGTMYKNSEGKMHFICQLNDSIYMDVTSNNASPAQMREIVSRLGLSIVR